jgi:hypothetical protein
MNLRDICNNAAKILFVIASAMLVVAFAELAASALGFSVTFETYSAGRLIELSAALLIYVIAVLLRQIRDALTDKA